MFCKDWCQPVSMCPLRPGTAEPSGLVPVNRQRFLATRWLSSAQTAAWLSQRPLQWISGNQSCSQTQSHRREEDGSDPEPLRFLPCLASLLSQLSHAVSHFLFQSFLSFSFKLFSPVPQSESGFPGQPGQASYFPTAPARRLPGGPSAACWAGQQEGH